MAKLIKRASKAQGEPGEGTAATEGEDLAVLMPDSDVLLADGRRVVVREFRFGEWLRVLQRVEPMVAAIAAALERGGVVSYQQAVDITSEHMDELLPLVAQCADLPLQDVEALSPEDGELLLMTWWGINSRFFVNRAVNRVAVARAELQALAQSASAGPGSSLPSRDTATTPSG